jgi:hypothetical protein
MLEDSAFDLEAKSAAPSGPSRSRAEYRASDPISESGSAL